MWLSLKCVKRRTLQPSVGISFKTYGRLHRWQMGPTLTRSRSMVCRHKYSVGIPWNGTNGYKKLSFCAQTLPPLFKIMLKTHIWFISRLLFIELATGLEQGLPRGDETDWHGHEGRHYKEVSCQPRLEPFNLREDDYVWCSNGRAYKNRKLSRLHISFSNNFVEKITTNWLRI